MSSSATELGISVTGFGKLNLGLKYRGEEQLKSSILCTGVVVIVKSMYIWNLHMRTDGQSRLQLLLVPRAIDCRGYVHRPNLGRFHFALRPHGVWTLKLKSLENIVSCYRQFLYYCLNLCFTKLLKFYNSLHTACQTSDKN